MRYNQFSYRDEFHPYTTMQTGEIHLTPSLLSFTVQLGVACLEDLYIAPPSAFGKTEEFSHSLLLHPFVYNASRGLLQLYYIKFYRHTFQREYVSVHFLKTDSYFTLPNFPKCRNIRLLFTYNGILHKTVFVSGI